MTRDSKLFTPLKIGRHTLSNRLVLAPLTRCRNDDAHVPAPFVKDYYAQRASTPGTLLITEGTMISQRGAGWPNTPSIWSDEQVAAWKEIVDAVHEAGGIIFMQILALGRAAHPDELRKDGGFTVKAPSAIAIDPSSSDLPGELTNDEIYSLIDDFAQAAKNAVDRAGFDGVELHGANGYLIDQFTQDTANQRTDEWGGSIEKRARFAVEVTKAVVSAVGKDKVGYRASPWSEFQAMHMQGIVPQFTYLFEELKKLGLAYLHLVESRVSGGDDSTGKESLQPFTQVWGNTSPILIAGGFDAALAAKLVDHDYPEQDVAVVLGRHFLATPDLVYRVKNGLALNPYDRPTFYSAMSETGYTDYPFSDEFLAEQQIKQQAVQAH